MPNVPNQYHVHGGGISVSHYPDGFGPPVAERGRLLFVYQDAHRSESFFSDGNEVRTVKADDHGMAETYAVTELDGTAAFGPLPL
jgi:hypothetical protein